MHCECTDNKHLFFPNDSGRKSFERLPTKKEWARFRKYARRMRELDQHYTLPASLEVLSTIQLCTINESLLPNLKTLSLSEMEGSFIPYIPLFFSPRTTSIFLTLYEPDSSKALIASMVTALSILCPDLQVITLDFLLRDPMITAAVSGMLLDSNQNTLQELSLDSPLTEEAAKVICKLHNLRSLWMVIDRETPLPSAQLPNLTELTITCDDEDDWPQLFCGATLGKLESVTFYPQSEQLGDFLGVFEGIASSSSVQNTLLRFNLSASCSWNPNYFSLLPFTRMERLVIDFSCDGGCPSRVDDDVIIKLSRAMPKLTTLQLGGDPCRRSTTGVTAKGLVALAHHCPALLILRIHLQAASLSTPPASPRMIPNAQSSASQVGCALTNLSVGETPIPEESALIVALTLLLIFPRINFINSFDEVWKKVEDAIRNSREIVNCSSK